MPVEKAHGAGDDAVMEGDVRALFHGIGFIMLLLRPGQSAVDAFDDLFHGEIGTDMQLRGVSHFDIAHIFRDIVLNQFIGRPLQVFGGLQYGTGQRESFQVVRQVFVFFLEDQFF